MFSAIENKEILPFVTTWMGLEITQTYIDTENRLVFARGRSWREGSKMSERG